MKTRHDPAGTSAGYLSSPDGYVRISIDGKRYPRARLVWLYFHGVFPKNQIDHINGIKNDDRIENLREATNAENAQNKRKARKDSQTEMGTAHGSG